MSNYDYQYVSLSEAWGRVPKYSKYSFYQSDKNEYGQTFTSFDNKGPQLDRDYERGYHTKREFDSTGSSNDASRKYVIKQGEITPSPPVRDTISIPEIVQKCDEYGTKLNYSKAGYPNTMITEYFNNFQNTKEQRIIKFYNKAIIILLLGLLLKWILDKN
jgi:hypothetical protein